jgi:hypothetical protein
MIQYQMPLKAPHSRKGFALVIALSLMAFILVLLLSITTLVRVETTAADISLAQLEARQNALMSGYLAIGELQRTAGPDQRITARADIFNSSALSKQHYTGVWTSEAPNAGAQVAWLASDWEPTNPAYATQPAPASGAADAVLLVGDSSVDATNNPDDAVRLSMANTLIEGASGTTGRYAWWVADENNKASVRPLSDPTTSGPNETRYRAVRALADKGAAELAVLTAFSGDTVDPLDSLKVRDIADLELSGYNVAGLREHFHDYTVNSFGVLSNTRDGGLKQDLSLAFEMSDSDFSSSRFASGGSDPVTVIGSGGIRAQPIFRDTNGGRGPSWHLLRDYYTIYQRMQNPLTDPVFPAQHFLPNTDELGSPNDWKDYAAMRFSKIETWRDGTAGDPLLSNTLPYLYRGQYAPYLQRWQQTLGLLFEPTTAPTGLDVPGVNWVEPVVLVNPVAVFHNPYNVKVEHYGFMTLINHIRTNILMRRITPGFESATNESTDANRSLFKVPPGTIDPGVSEVYGAVGEDDGSNFSTAGTPKAEDFFEPSGATSPTYKVAEDPNNTGPNLEVDFAPFASQFANATGQLQRWAVWHFNNMGSASNPVLSSFSRNNGFDELYNYGGYQEDYSILHSVESHREWLDLPESFVPNRYIPDRDGIFVDTRNHRRGTGDAPLPYLVLNDYLKPADDRLAYSTYSLYNPHAPMKGATNLLSDQDGTPVYTPAWQMTLSRSTVPAGANVLESANSGLNAYGGNSNTGGGQLKVAPLELPVIPPSSFGDLQSANVGILSTMPALAIGNSYATPYLARDQITGQFQNQATRNNPSQPRLYHDLSYHLNEALWDDYFFSTYSVPYNLNADNFDPLSNPPGQSFDAAFDPSFNNSSLLSGSLPNPRMALLPHETENLADVKNKLFRGDDTALSTGISRTAENLLVAGAFNVNSTSVDAWAAILAAGRGGDLYQSGETAPTTLASNQSALSRAALPADDAFDGNQDPFSSNQEPAWSGYRTLTDDQIRDLAQAIVDELRARVDDQGHPFLGLSAFVNRNLSNDDFGLSGLLQAAIDKSGLNSRFDDFRADFSSFPASASANDQTGAARSSAAGAAGYINQGDLLKAIGSFIQVRSDTFKIRSYGEVVDPISGQVASRAWCEIIAQRIPEPVYPNGSNPEADPQYWEPDPSQPDFGRRFRVISIRFLDSESV